MVFAFVEAGKLIMYGYFTFLNRILIIEICNSGSLFLHFKFLRGHCAQIVLKFLYLMRNDCQCAI